MSYLAQGLQSGFNLGFQARTQRKRDDQGKAERDAERALMQKRQLLQDARYEDQLARQQERQMVEDARYRSSQEQELARDARNFAFQKDRAATADLNATMDRSRQARMDYSAEVDKARRDPMQEQILVEQARALKLQNDAFGQPKPQATIERLEFDPFDETAPPKRTITGPAGQLGELGAPALQPPQQDLSAYEGRIVRGPDNKRYIIKNGIPVPTQ